MSTSYSPLRYPGGKSKLLPLFSCLVNENNHDSYIEAFAGGAGVAIGLIVTNKVHHIIINDYDIAIFSFWKTLLEHNDWFIDKIITTPVTIEEWKAQKDIYVKEKTFSKELGFATFFLNRANHSGILKAGPIGGMQQTGKWKIDARFNKENLIDKLQKIYEHKDGIEVYNYEVREFIDFLNKRKDLTHPLIYLDPPYYKKGQQLYKNFFDDHDHIEISEKIGKLNYDWIVTYDNEAFIKDLYAQYSSGEFALNYSLSVKREATEFIALSNKSIMKTIIDNIKKHNIFIRQLNYDN